MTFHFTNEEREAEFRQPEWQASRSAALRQLELFLPNAGSHYARTRNFDLGPDDRSNVSCLSPWLRHRLIQEEEVLQATLTRHDFRAAEKFIQEVFWRGYFKGWLEHRPEVWRQYSRSLTEQLRQLDCDASFMRRYEEAVEGTTGIACFDHWAQELRAHGYLHNHARMWFASLWIFTLDLPWELGADFFYRHLVDGDPASNTCSWRWIGGLHTVGKTYLATASNIERFTNGRFHPEGQLAQIAESMPENIRPEPIAPRWNDALPDRRFGLLITEEDCTAEITLADISPDSILALQHQTERSPFPMGECAKAFAPQAVEDAAHRARDHFDCNVILSDSENWETTIRDWVMANDLDSIVTSRLAVGPVKDRLRRAMVNIETPLIEVDNPYDRAVWPHAIKGFFKLKKKIPIILSDLGLS